MLFVLWVGVSRATKKISGVLALIRVSCVYPKNQSGLRKWTWLSRKQKRPAYAGRFSEDADPGLEPGLSESESDVLPLDESAL